ncbi:hypothetical protein [Leisingera caerulea]|uniref:hypothetical protein n=1 Tax=Leisingera caerulea TaxID=506591 RepID=UPI0012B57FEC|nr:hypothetical protein [Leisingera caerulea]
MDFLSGLLTALGLGARRSEIVSDRRSEAFRLNAEVEAKLLRLDSFQKFERIKLVNTLMTYMPNEVDALHSCEEYFDKLEQDIVVGKQTVINSNATISAGSSFAALQKWDEVIALLHRQSLAVDEQLVATTSIVEHFHTLLNQAIEELRTQGKEINNV